MQTARKRPTSSYTVHQGQGAYRTGARPYVMLAAMVGIHFVVMYVLMYLMVDTFADAFLNINNVYMSGAMAAPMAILMLLFMKRMYPDRGRSLAVYAVSAALLVGFIWFTRQQIGVGDVQFIRSMVPHHSGAILMCNQAPIQDPELKSLCGRIIRGQQDEIDQMKRILARLQK